MRRKATGTMPTEKLDIKVEPVEYPLGDSNYPISPKMRITNNSTQTLPGGAEFQFDYPVAAPNNMTQQSGWSLAVTRSDHTGPNAGGFRGNFHHVSLKLPTWQTLAPGATADVAMAYQLPISGPSNYTVTFGGKSYGLVQDYGRGGTGPSPTPTPTPTSSNSPTPTPTPTASHSPTPSPTPTPTPTGGTCTAPAWSAGAIYVKDNVVSHAGHSWKAKWWTTNERPGTTGEWGVWIDLGAC